MTQFYSNVFEIPPNSNSFTSQQNSEGLPSIHKNYLVVNVGKVPITAEVLYGNSEKWLGTSIESTNIKPAEEKVLIIPKDLYLLTTVKIFNNDPKRALVHVGIEDGTDWNKTPKLPLKININNISETLIKFGPGKIPIVEDKLDPIIDFFWPQTGSIWTLVIDDYTQIPTKIKCELRRLRERIKSYSLLLEQGSPGANIAFIYMQLMEELVGFEKKFVTTTDYSNYIFLPYFTSAVSLKLCLFQFGMLNRNKIKLSDDQVRRLLLITKQMIEDKSDGAVLYINRTFSKALTNEYNTCDPQLLYDSMATVRSYCGLGGLEFIPYWIGILANPFWKKKAYNDTVIYSTYFGRPSPQLLKQLVLDDVTEPLQPVIVNGIRDKIVKIDVCSWRKNYKSSPKIGGMLIHYESGKYYQLGKCSQEIETFYFNDLNLVKLTAWGNGAVDSLEFGFSDGRKETFGAKNRLHSNYRIFMLEGHFICGIYLSNDVPTLEGQIANIAVSYQLITEA